MNKVNAAKLLLILLSLGTIDLKGPSVKKSSNPCKLEAKNLIASVLNESLEVTGETKVIAPQDLSQNSQVALKSFSKCAKPKKRKLRGGETKITPKQAFENNLIYSDETAVPYANDFYQESNAIGYTGVYYNWNGSPHDQDMYKRSPKPTVYYFKYKTKDTEWEDEEKLPAEMGDGYLAEGTFGHIKQSDEDSHNIGRARVMEGIYAITNHPKYKGNAVEICVIPNPNDPDHPVIQILRVENSKFTRLSQLIDSDMKLLYRITGNFDKEKTERIKPKYLNRDYRNKQIKQFSKNQNI